MPRRSPSSTPQPGRAEPGKAVLHPRNRHTGRYDFPALIAGCPELVEYVILNPYGKQSIDFANPDAVRVFNRALLRQFYGIQHWDIPPGYLCPPVPGRADYLHGLADLLGQNDACAIPRGTAIHALDIGTGANCIYPLIGHREYGWHFTGSDIDTTALASARTIVSANGLAKAIELRQQAAPKHIFKGVMLPEDRFDLTLCNPPFHASPAEASSIRAANYPRSISAVRRRSSGAKVAKRPLSRAWRRKASRSPDRSTGSVRWYRRAPTWRRWRRG